MDVLFRLIRYPSSTYSIHGLTKSLVQSLTPLLFSIIAFVFGMVVVISTWSEECVFFHAEH